jgi:predicted nucleotidyltransferase
MRELDDIALDPTDRQAVEEAARVLRDRFDVAEIVLFGSKARGTAGPYSDLDLLILTRGQPTQRDRLAMSDALYELELEREVLFGRLVVGQDDWYNGVYQVLAIRSEVERDGVRL